MWWEKPSKSSCCEKSLVRAWSLSNPPSKRRHAHPTPHTQPHPACLETSTATTTEGASKQAPSKLKRKSSTEDDVVALLAAVASNYGNRSSDRKSIFITKQVCFLLLFCCFVFFLFLRFWLECMPGQHENNNNMNLPPLPSLPYTHSKKQHTRHTVYRTKSHRLTTTRQIAHRKTSTFEPAPTHQMDV